MILAIITNGHATLRKVATPIEPAFLHRKKTKQLIADMIETMRDANGIGLAAPQINRSIRLVVIALKDGALVLGNPAITRRSLRQTREEEGCLSVPGVFGNVRRHQKLTVKFLDRDGVPQTLTASGLFARVVQHEVDHLNGRLYIDRTRDFTKGRP